MDQWKRRKCTKEMNEELIIKFNEEVNKIVKMQEDPNADEKKLSLEKCKLLSIYGFQFRISKRGEKRADKLHDKYYSGERFKDDELKDVCCLLTMRSSLKTESHLFELVKELQEEMTKRFGTDFSIGKANGQFTEFLFNRGYIEPNPNFIPALQEHARNQLLREKDG